MMQHIFQARNKEIVWYRVVLYYVGVFFIAIGASPVFSMGMLICRNGYIPTINNLI